LTIQALTLADQQLFLTETSPLTTRCIKVNPELYETSSEQDEESAQLLLEDVKRIKLLFEIYLELTPSEAKAKVAYTLAVQEMDQGNIDLAEKLFFEALYILGILR